MAYSFKVSVLFIDGFAVTPYDLIVPPECLFESNSDFAGCNAKITLPKTLSNQTYYVADEVDALMAKSNGDYQTKKVYYALISQSGTANPTWINLNNGDDNYLGAVTWTRTSAGLYKGTITGKLNPNIFVPPVYKNDGTIAITDTTSNVPDYITVNTGADDKLTNSPIQIQVFSYDGILP